MIAPSSPPPEKPRRSTIVLSWLAVVLAVVAFLAFLILIPGGFLTKADLTGYAVCHRIEARSLVIAGRQLPLCARCSGTFIGALVGFFGQATVLRRHRAGEFPPPRVIVALVLFMLMWAADGLNSYMTLFPNGPHLYEPQNWLRMTTGALNGLALSALVYPVFNFTLWRHPTSERAIHGLRDLGVLVLLEACLVGVAITRWSLLLYPLALLSAVGVLGLLTSVNSMLVLMLVRRENAVDNWREAVVPLLAGFAVSLVQVGVIDAVRFALTGTLTGIPPLQ